jgi:hypothetical protein
MLKKRARALDTLGEESGCELWGGSCILRCDVDANGVRGRNEKWALSMSWRTLCAEAWSDNPYSVMQKAAACRIQTARSPETPLLRVGADYDKVEAYPGIASYANKQVLGELEGGRVERNQ